MRLLIRLAWLLTVLLVCASRGQAQQVRAHLLWQRPAESHCPARGDLQADVAQAVDVAFVDEASADVLVRGAIAELADGVHVSIEASSRAGVSLGKRALDAPPGQCAALRSTIALVLTVLLDQVASRAQPTDTRPGALGLGAALGLRSGVAPRVSGGGALALWFGLRPALSLQLEASYFLPVVVETRGGPGARLQSAGLAARLCPRLVAHRSWSLALCAGAELGALFVAPRSLPGSNQVRALGQALLDARVRFQVRTLALEAALGALGAMHRPKVSYQRSDAQEVKLYRLAPVGIFFSLGLIKW